MIDLAHKEQIAILTISRSTTNPINLDLVEQLYQQICQIRDDPDIHGLVLTSASEKFFSIGFDLPDLIDLPRKQFEHFFERFNQLSLELYTLPKPTIAALTGHAIAGGCILAICCDYRLSAAGRKLMGLNEIKLGVPVPYLTDAILHHTTGTLIARNVLETGDLFDQESSLRIGLIDRILPAETLLPEAVAMANTLSNQAPSVYALIKSTRIEPVVERVTPLLAKKQSQFMECWFSTRAEGLLRQALDKF